MSSNNTFTIRTDFADLEVKHGPGGDLVYNIRPKEGVSEEDIAKVSDKFEENDRLVKRPSLFRPPHKPSRDKALKVQKKIENAGLPNLIEQEEGPAVQPSPSNYFTDENQLFGDNTAVVCCDLLQALFYEESQDLDLEGLAPKKFDVVVPPDAYYRDTAVLLNYHEKYSKHFRDIYTWMDYSHSARLIDLAYFLWLKDGATLTGRNLSWVKRWLELGLNIHIFDNSVYLGDYPNPDPNSRMFASWTLSMSRGGALVPLPIVLAGAYFLSEYYPEELDSESFDPFRRLFYTGLDYGTLKYALNK